MKDLKKLNDYLKFNSFYEDLDDDDVKVHFEIWGSRNESNKLQNLLEKLELSFTYDFEKDGGHPVHMFDVNKEQIDNLVKI
jgi:hypothetical protein